MKLSSIGLLLLFSAISSANEAGLKTYQRATIKPGIGIGDIQLGKTTRAQVETLLGAAQEKYETPAGTTLYYKNGLAFYFRNKSALTRIIAGPNPAGPGPFEGKTAKGAPIAKMKRPQVLAAYGKTKKEKSKRHRNSGDEFSSGIAFHFDQATNEVRQIEIYKVESP